VADPIRDPARSLPRMVAYLDQLPAGAASYPDCLAKASMLRRALAERPLAREHVEALAPGAARIVSCPPLDGEWVPDVWLASILLAIADAYGMSDEQYLDWMRELNTRMFNTIFRLLMKVAPPDLIVRTASARWSVFHRGSTLTVVDSAPGRCAARLAFPVRLFHGLALRQFVAVFEAAARLSDPAATVALTSSDDHGARFDLAWTR
jgi:hypothetical protein